MGADLKAARALVVAGALLASPSLARAQAAEPPPPTPTGDTWQNPAKAADPPDLVPPTRPPPSEPGPPTSTSGTDLVPVSPPTPTTIVVTDREAVDRSEARLDALEEQAARDEHRIRTLEEQAGLFRHLHIGAMVQAQFLTQSFNAAASPNLQPNGLLPANVSANDTIARSDGTTTNSTLFRVRRARLRATYETDVMRLYIQLDGLPEGGVGPGIGTILRNAEATGIARWTENVRTELTAGLFLIPFRRELLEISQDRPFIERTWFVQNVFPTERDYGVHARTFAFDDRLQVDVAMINGQVGQATFVSLPDLDSSKDFLASVSYRGGAASVGASGYVGRGALIDRQALRFKQFGKNAVNIDTALDGRVLPVGPTRLSAELTIGRNMDTGVIYAFARPSIPTTFANDVGDVRQSALYIRLEQDLGRWLTAGYRYDTYTPDTSLANNARDTHAFLLVGKISRNLRWMNELGWAIDNVHPSATAPPSKHILYFSSVLQAMF